MQVQERFAVLSQNLDLYFSLAPDMFSVEYVKLLPRLGVDNCVFLQPVLMILKSLLVLFLLVFTAITLAFDHHLDGLVYDLGLPRAPLSNVLPADGAVLLANETLLDALLTEGVATDGCSAADYKFHADRAV